MRCEVFLWLYPATTCERMEFILLLIDIECMVKYDLFYGILIAGNKTFKKK